MEFLIETERLLMRPLMEEDATFMFQLNSDPEVMKFTGEDAFESVEQARQFLKDYDQYEKYMMGRFTCLQKEDNVIIGWCGLKFNEDGPIKDMVDLGYRFFKSSWGKGLATEASKGCIKYGFENLNLEQIIARSALENKGSFRVMQKAGMKFWKFGSEYGTKAAYYFLDKEEYLHSKNINL